MQKIMFNDRYGLTKAVLDGKKTQTRRLALHSKEDVQVLEEINFKSEDKSIVQYIIEKYSRFKVGETVAVAQSYKELNKEYITNFNCELIRNGVIKSTNTRINIDDPVTDSPVRHWGDNPTKVCSMCKNQADCFEKYFRWIDSIAFENKLFVKTELLLHQIRITGIRLERLQDISDEDCLAEGIRRWADEKEYASNNTVRKSVDELKAAGYDAYAIPDCWNCFTSPKAAYAALIDKVSGKGSWEKNPWVFVYNFELVE